MGYRRRPSWLPSLGCSRTRNSTLPVPGAWSHPPHSPPLPWGLTPGLAGCAVCVLLGLFSHSIRGAALDPVNPPLRLPTPNTTLLEPDPGERYFVGTAGNPWTHGGYGCTRTGGWQFHEGIDIRPLQRDARGEAVDPIFATADGRVAYVNSRAALSAYGIYIVIQHHISGIELYSLYAHLAEVQPGLAPGQPVSAGEVIGKMGRTANTREVISRDRAHLHFELALLVNPRYPEWLQSSVPGARNDHGVWNGQNLIGLDPRILLLSSHRYPHNFDLIRFLRVQRQLCRVAVRVQDFDFLRRYAPLVQARPELAQSEIAGHEIHLDYAGIPVRIYPRTEAELPSPQRYTLIDVDEQEYRQNPCRRIVTRQGNRFTLGRAGIEFLDLLTY
jgi:peptidoglycan LD-endopeptidase LytH